jgi:hypothetical protein
MIRDIALIAAAALLVVAHAPARADDDPCARNHYILWSGPDHVRAQCITIVDDDDGTVAPVAKGFATAVEYYQVDDERYFTTADATEVAALDAGLFPGWHRTGSRYRVRAEAGADAMPICRIYVPAAPGRRGFHFYSRSPAACAAELGKRGGYDEGVVFYAPAPDASGQCADGTAPVWKLEEAGGPAFAYTPNAKRRDTLAANGYAITGVEFCVPSSADRAASMTALLELETWTIDEVPFQSGSVTMNFGGAPDDEGVQDYFDFPAITDTRVARSPIVRLGNAGWDPLMDEYVGYSKAMAEDMPGYYGLTMWTFWVIDGTWGRACTSEVHRNFDLRSKASHPFQNVLVEPCMPSSASVIGPRGAP